MHLLNLKLAAHRLGQTILERELEEHVRDVRMALLGADAWKTAVLETRRAVEPAR